MHASSSSRGSVNVKGASGVSMYLAVLPAPLHYREIQILKHQALRKRNYNSALPLSEAAEDNLRWLIHHFQEMNGQPISRDQPSLEIYTDSMDGVHTARRPR